MVMTGPATPVAAGALGKAGALPRPRAPPRLEVSAHTRCGGSLGGPGGRASACAGPAWCREWGLPGTHAQDCSHERPGRACGGPCRRGAGAGAVGAGGPPGLPAVPQPGLPGPRLLPRAVLAGRLQASGTLWRLGGVRVLGQSWSDVCGRPHPCPLLTDQHPRGRVPLAVRKRGLRSRTCQGAVCGLHPRGHGAPASLRLLGAPAVPAHTHTH